MKTDRICAVCNKKFNITMKNQHKKYCSRECYIQTWDSGYVKKKKEVEVLIKDPCIGAHLTTIFAGEVEEGVVV